MARKRASQKEGLNDMHDLGHKLKIFRDFKLTEKQQELLKLLLDDSVKVVFITGPAGTSKTYLAMYAALQKLNNDPELDMLYLRSAIENCVRTLGHLPGTIGEKFSPYVMPMHDKLFELISPSDISNLEKEMRIHAEPINYLRGADWRHKFVVIDEAQNMRFDELVTVLTRAGEDTKMVFCGDLMQSDIKDGGYSKICDIFSEEDSIEMGIRRFDFTELDVVRSKLVQFIVTKLK